MTIKEVKQMYKEVEAVIDNKMVDTLLFYFDENKKDREAWGDAFRVVFSNRVKAILRELEEADKENS